MDFTEQDVQVYLRQKFQGRESFLNSIIFPIFGEERFENGFDDPVLEGATDLRDAAEKCGIKSIIRYGDIQIDLGSIHLFEITVSNRVLLKRNRVNVQRIVRRMMGTYTGAFMIFHYDDDQAWDWRFSFCCKDDKNFTESRRYTFLLGEHQPCRTAAQNFVKLAKVTQEGSVPSLKDIVTAFDVEAVSREFFVRYKGHYEKFVRYITGKYFKKENGKFVEKDEGSANEAMYAGFNHDDKAVRDYVKKLLGRIVFLHFLQKKGWMGAKKGWSDGDPDFMLHLYQRSSDRQKGDFLDAVLEPLFDAALDTDRRDKDDIFDTGVVGVGKVRIPYLNGGLFTRDRADEVKSAFPRDYFRDLLVFFSEYNFTIDENDPNDAEVGVDPEMLSRIFENLLEDNRDKGAYYTLKVVVDYMCRRSLTAYLCVGQNEADCKKIEEFVLTHDAEKLPKKLAATILKRLKDVKVCDPAIGSGAFPMGMLKLIYLCRIALGDETPSSTLKKEIIENNIYGVDIEKGAVDIARLRFWLALVVDEDTPRALPNLDFKIMQGNSLLENYKGVDLSKLLENPVKRKPGRKTTGKIVVQEFSFDSTQAKEKIANLMRDYYEPKKVEIKRELLKAIDLHVKSYLLDAGARLDNDTLSFQNSKFFLWHTWFNDVFARGGFDIMIGNPPYIKEDFCRAAFDGFRETSDYYMGKMDLWYGFACHGIDMLAQHGILCFIAQNNWTTSFGAKLMRKKVVLDTRFHELVDFNEYMVFGEDNPDGPQIQTMIMMFERDNSDVQYEFDHWRLSAEATKVDMRAMLTHEEGPAVRHINPTIDRARNAKGLLTFSGDTLIFDKISKNKLYLTENEATNGIHPHHDFVGKKMLAECPGLKVGQGIFGLTNKEKAELKFSAKELALIKPYYTSDQVKLYYTNAKNDLWIIYTGSEFKDPKKMDSYPNIKAHLDAFKKVITSDNRPYGLHRARAEHFFNGEKIVVLRKCVGRPLFSYSDFPCYVSATFYVIQTNRWDMKFLTGVLNSRLIAYWLKHRGKMQGENYQLDKDPLKSIPLPELPRPAQKPIAELVGQILAAKKAYLNADTAALESEIDQLVYRLYDLTPEEIAVVEGK